jgi:hypothetical protein
MTTFTFTFMQEPYELGNNLKYEKLWIKYYYCFMLTVFLWSALHTSSRSFKGHVDG